MRSKLLTSCLLAGIAVALVISAARREQQHVAPPFRAASSAAEVPPPSWAAQEAAPVRHGATAPANIQPKLVASYGKLPLSFEANQGQTDGRVRFLARGGGYTIFLTDDEAVLTLRKSHPGMSRFGKLGLPGRLDPFGSVDPRAGRWPSLADDVKSLWPSLIPDLSQLVPEPNAGKGAVAGGLESQSPQVMRMRLVGGNARARVVGLDELPGRSNYFIGNDPKKWRTNVPNYGRVKYENVYPGIALVYYGNQRQLEYDFVVAPGANPRMIALSINGAEKLEIDTQGDLVLHADAGDVLLHKPLVYQATTGKGPRTTDPAGNSPFTIHHSQLVQGRYVLAGNNQVSFEVTRYDKTKPLIIDPVLSYSTYLGGSSDDLAGSIAVDASGNAYVTGSTNSINFPTIPGAFQTSFGGGGYDAFVTKVNAAGSALVYSTYLGGSSAVGGYNAGYDYGYGIAVDGTGDAYVTGQTWSNNFPTTPGAFQTSYQGGGGDSGDAFITKLNAAGSALVYSTYLGGSNEYDMADGIAVDATGNAYVTGDTWSSNFPITPGAFQTSKRGSADAFVTKLNAAGNALVYSTYLGGSNWDGGSGIAVDSSGNAYVTGWTDSSNFPTTPGAFQTSFRGGNNDAFVAKLNAAGSALVYSTYLGGSNYDSSGYADIAYGIAVDAAGNAYVTGFTTSSDFPTTPGAFQPGWGGGRDAFVTKLNAAGSALVYSTYLGGSNYDSALAIAVDAIGNAYVAGYTSSSNFPTTPGAFQSNYGGAPYDAIVAKLNAAGSALVYSTYLGGSDHDYGYGIALDSAGNAYVTGSTVSTDFPTANPLQAANAGGYDAFVAKISPSAPGVGLSPTSLTFSDQVVGTTSAAQTVMLTNVGVVALSISAVALTGTNSADFAQTTDCGSSVLAGSYCTISVTFAPTATGTRTGAVSITDNAAGSPHEVSLTGTGIGAPAVTLSPTSLNFGNQQAGTTSAAQTVTLTNTGNAVLNITSIAITGDFAQTNHCDGSVAAGGASCTISVTFTPTATGTRTGTLTVTDNAAGSPHVVSLAGTGVAPAVTLSPTSLNFSSELVGTAGGAQTVTLTNTGNVALAITSIAVSGANAGDFAQTNTCGATVAAGAHCTISVTFAPTAGGTRSGGINVTDNAADSPQTVSLSGTGLDFRVRAASGTSLTQTVAGGQPATYNLAFTPVGASGTLALSCAGAPAGATCTIDPSSLTLSGTNVANATVTVTTTAKTMVPGQPRVPRLFGRPNGSLLRWMAWMVMLTWMLISLLRRRRRPVWLALGATMLLAVVWVGCGGGAPRPRAPGVSLSPSSLTFSSQNMDASSAAQKVTLTNSGNALLSITSIAASGDFGQSNSCVPVVQAGANCAINVRFSPTATGARTGSLTISDNASGSPQTVSLSGTGVPPATPPGTYNLTVTATLTSGSSTLTHTVGLTLIVN